MDQVNREEMKACIAASDARMDAVVVSMRADSAEFRAQLRAESAEFRAQMQVGMATLTAELRDVGARMLSLCEETRADARVFYAEAGKTLAEIKCDAEKERSHLLTGGYRLLVWLTATAIACSGVAIGMYQANS